MKDKKEEPSDDVKEKIDVDKGSQSEAQSDVAVMVESEDDARMSGDGDDAPVDENEVQVNN